MFVDLHCVIIVLVLREVSSTATVIEVNVSSSLSSVNVTAFGGNSRLDGIFFDINVTWFDAAYHCSLSGYGRMEHASKNWQRWHNIFQMLRDRNYRYPFHVWLGAFRVTNDTTWYTGNHTCDLLSGSQHVTGSGQCLSAYISDFFTSPFMEARDCLDEHPFMCYTRYEFDTTLLYEGFKIQSFPNFTKQVISESISEENCTAQCDIFSFCVSYEYNVLNGTCKTLYFKKFYGYVTYTLIRTAENISHAVIYGSDYKYSNISMGNVLDPSHYKFSPCNFTFVPPGFCLHGNNTRCQSHQGSSCYDCETGNSTSTDNDDVITFEIQKDTTSKTRRRYTSAEDNRILPTTLGILSAVIIATPFCLLVFTDARGFQARMKRKRDKRIKKGKENIKETERKTERKNL